MYCDKTTVILWSMLKIIMIMYCNCACNKCFYQFSSHTNIHSNHCIIFFSLLLILFPWVVGNGRLVTKFLYWTEIISAFYQPLSVPCLWMKNPAICQFCVCLNRDKLSKFWNEKLICYWSFLVVLVSLLLQITTKTVVIRVVSFEELVFDFGSKHDNILDFPILRILCSIKARNLDGFPIYIFITDFKP